MKEKNSFGLIIPGQNRVKTLVRDEYVSLEKCPNNLKSEKLFFFPLEEKIKKHSSNFSYASYTLHNHTLDSTEYSLTQSYNKTNEYRAITPIGKSKKQSKVLFEREDPSPIFNKLGEDVLLSPRNKICKKTAINKSLKATRLELSNDGGPSKLNLLQLMTDNATMQSDRSIKDFNKKLSMGKIMAKQEPKQISESTKSKLNDIYEITGQRLM